MSPLVPLRLPEPLHNQLQVGCGDLVAVQVGAIPVGEPARAALVRRELIRPELAEDRIDQARFDLDGQLVRVQFVEACDRLLDRLPRGFPGQVLQMEVVAVDIADPALEQVSQPGVGVFPDRDEEVRAEVGPVDAGGELVGETAAVCFPRPVKEVLLELVEHHQQGRVGSVACGLDRLVQPLERAAGRRGCRAGMGLIAFSISPISFAGGIVSPGAEDDRDVPGGAPLLDAALGQLRQLGRRRRPGAGNSSRPRSGRTRASAGKRGDC